MALDPEQVYAALFARLQAQISGLKLATRRRLGMGEVAPERLPAMIVLAERGAANRQYAVGSIWTLSASVTFYVRDPSDKTQTVETQIFALLKALDAALARQPGEASPDEDPGTTLGGLVFRCFRQDFEIFQAVDSGPTAVSVLIEMVAPE